VVTVVGAGGGGCLVFQAVDGIRERNVTGVQTCALPISTAILKQTPANTRHNAASNFSPVDTRTRTSRRDAIVRCVVIATPRINSSVVIINKTATVVSFMVIRSTLFRVSVLHRLINSGEHLHGKE